MYRCLNAGNVGVSLNWESCLPLARAAGFTGFDIPVTPETDCGKVRDLLAAHNLRPGGQPLPFDFRGSEAAFLNGLKTLRAVAEKAAGIGQTRFYIWIWPYSDTLAFKDNFRFHADRLGQAATIMRDAGCRLGLEFLGPRHYREGHPFSFVHTLGGMLDLADAIGPNAGLLLDSWHWHTSLGTVDEIRALKNEQVVYVHINDAPRGIPVEDQYDYVRAVPGETGVLNLPGFLDALRTIGYDGPVVPEPFVSALSAMQPEAALRRVATGLDRIWDVRPRPPLPSTMKVLATGRRKAWLVDLPVPRPQGNEVVVKLHACPICGSNLGAFLGDGEWVNTGHEGAGEVVAVAESQRLRVGDRVALAPLNACGRCSDCLRGDVIFCRNRPAIHGTFAPFTRVADVMCAKVPDDLDYDHASLMGCALGPAYEAIKRLGVGGLDTLVVSGLGPVGLGASALASAIGTRVVALDPEPFRRELAARIGAAVTLDPSAPDIREALLRAVGADGIRKSIDCSGKESAERLLIDLASIRGAVAFVGENGGTIPLSPSRDMIRKGLTLLGCWHMNMLDAPDLIEFLRRHPAKAGLLISHRFAFDHAQEAFEVFASRQTAKVILHP
jgi:threonine dehydrogenase-like Zn-dependent dehydrogenase/sugar phosphate isomerase/epimerase